MLRDPDDDEPEVDYRRPGVDRRSDKARPAELPSHYERLGKMGQAALETRRRYLGLVAALRTPELDQALMTMRAATWAELVRLEIELNSAKIDGEPGRAEEAGAALLDAWKRANAGEEITPPQPARGDPASEPLVRFRDALEDEPHGRMPIGTAYNPRRGG